MKSVGHYVSTFLAPTEGWIYDQLRYARAVGSIVLTKRIANSDSFPWTPVYATGRSLLQELGRLMRGFYPLHAEACLRHDVRLLHAHFGNRAVFALRLADHLGIPLIASFYGRDLAGPDPYERLFRDGARFLAEGPAARQRLIEIGCPADKVRIHRLGVNPDAIDFHERMRRADEPLRILMVGRFVEKKGFVFGIRAFSRAAKTCALRLTIVGDAGRDAAEQAIKRQLLTEAQTSDKIEFHGLMPLPKLLEIARSHHIVMQPSVVAADGDREGGHPVVLTLLAAAGMPAVATRHCDIPEIVLDEQTGWLSDERDEQGLTSAILRAAQSDLPKFSRAARALVESKYDIRQQTLDVAYAGLL